MDLCHNASPLAVSVLATRAVTVGEACSNNGRRLQLQRTWKKIAVQEDASKGVSRVR
jgi:hypothetical protein